MRSAARKGFSKIRKLRDELRKYDLVRSVNEFEKNELVWLVKFNLVPEKKIISMVIYLKGFDFPKKKPDVFITEDDGSPLRENIHHVNIDPSTGLFSPLFLFSDDNWIKGEGNIEVLRKKGKSGFTKTDNHKSLLYIIDFINFTWNNPQYSCVNDQWRGFQKDPEDYHRKKSETFRRFKSYSK